MAEGRTEEGGGGQPRRHAGHHLDFDGRELRRPGRQLQDGGGHGVDAGVPRADEGHPLARRPLARGPEGPVELGADREADHVLRGRQQVGALLDVGLVADDGLGLAHGRGRPPASGAGRRPGRAPRPTARRPAGAAGATATVTRSLRSFSTASTAPGPAADQGRGLGHRRCPDGRVDHVARVGDFDRVEQRRRVGAHGQIAGGGEAGDCRDGRPGGRSWRPPRGRRGRDPSGPSASATSASTSPSLASRRGADPDNERARHQHDRRRVGRVDPVVAHGHERRREAVARRLEARGERVGERPAERVLEPDGRARHERAGRPRRGRPAPRTRVAGRGRGPRDGPSRSSRPAAAPISPATSFASSLAPWWPPVSEMAKRPASSTQTMAGSRSLCCEQRRHQPHRGARGHDEDEGVDVPPARGQDVGRPAVRVLVGEPASQGAARFGDAHHEHLHGAGSFMRWVSRQPAASESASGPQATNTGLCASRRHDPSARRRPASTPTCTRLPRRSAATAARSRAA